ncbi:MAG TPA: 30S ribosomal protein S17 [Lentisphaeria bacterium]|nr:MAG: 30S ribosomal protein S17 [Lentisphaerae bacterium GWF2_49_21]HBC85514.1 30S ribosomal protein S17 [Lentisphaeria bacterium]
MTQETEKRGQRKQRVGKVVSNSMTKTIIVVVERRAPHPLYKKVVKSRNRYVAHDEKNEAKPGDTVRIEETRPLSKTKRWRLLEIIEKAE